jgi:hypothetical protein
MDQLPPCRQCSRHHMTRATLARIAAAVAGRAFCRWYAAASGEPEDQVAQDHLRYVLAALRQSLRERVKDIFAALYHGIRPDAEQEVALLAAASGLPHDSVLSLCMMPKIQMPVLCEIAVLCGREIAEAWIREAVGLLRSYH